jgi:hypothetical protein
MAEFDELDELLRSSLKRAAQPGDSAGVADTIRARVAAGDVGTPAAGSTAPGFGGSGPLAWMPWVGAIVVLGLVGGVLGVAGVFGHPIQEVTSAVDSILMPPTVQATSCPDGPVVASVERGSRVVALARNADGTEVQIRNPHDVGQLLWVPTALVDADTGEAAVSTLPLGAACPTVTVARAPVVVPVTPVSPTKPTKPTKPAPGSPGDTTPPSVSSVTVTTNDNCHVVITAAAGDDVGVTSVTITLTSANTGSHTMTAVAGHWQYEMTQPPVFSSGSTTFTVIAHDAAGHSSSAKSATATVQCLI